VTRVHSHYNWHYVVAHRTLTAVRVLYGMKHIDCWRWSVIQTYCPTLHCMIFSMDTCVVQHTWTQVGIRLSTYYYLLLFIHYLLRFEVCAHKWAAVQEFNRGLAMLNNTKYGYSCRQLPLRNGNNMNCIGTRLAMSILRSTKSPDANAGILYLIN
jgi:hypothetical protein